MIDSLPYDRTIAVREAAGRFTDLYRALCDSIGTARAVVARELQVLRAEYLAAVEHARLIKLCYAAYQVGWRDFTAGRARAADSLVEALLA